MAWFSVDAIVLPKEIEITNNDYRLLTIQNLLIYLTWFFEYGIT